MGVHEFNSLLLSNTEGLIPFALQLTKDRESARDLYQDTLYKALAARDKYEPGTNIKAWMYTIMRFTFINEYRRNERKKQLVDHLQYAGKSINASFPAEENIRRKEVLEVINKLPQLYREACILYLEGYKYQEIATALNEPLGTVKSRIHFARRLLKKQIDR